MTLSQVVFANEKSETLSPDPIDVAGFESFMTRYVAGLDIELAAIKTLPSQKERNKCYARKFKENSL